MGRSAVRFLRGPAIFGSVQPGNRDRHENDRFIRQPVSNNTVFVFPDADFRVRLHLDNLLFRLSTCFVVAQIVAQLLPTRGILLRTGGLHPNAKH